MLLRSISVSLSCGRIRTLSRDFWKDLVKVKVKQNLNMSTTSTVAAAAAKGQGSRPKVLVTRSDFPKCAIDCLKSRCDLTFWKNPIRVPREILFEKVENVDGIFCTITDQINSELMERAGPNLKVVATMSVGYDHIDTKALRAKGVRIGHTPDVLTDSTAELTVAVLLAASRRLFEAHQKILNGEWSSSFWGPLWMCGVELSGSTVGIFGLGRIGLAVMARLAPFNVKKFIYNGRTKKNEVIDAEFVDFDTLLRESDFIIVTSPLTAATKEIFNERAFSLMKSNAVFVNTSRGGVVQQDALVRALKTGQIFAAGLDVMTPEPLPLNHELSKLDNCVIVPHIGSATISTRNQMAMLTAQNILGVLFGEKMPAEIL